MVLPNCKICTHPDKFVIQQMLDDGVSYNLIVDEYNISKQIIMNHKKNEHRDALIAFGVADFQARERGLELGNVLREFIELWREGLRFRNWEDIKDSDVMVALISLAMIECGSKKHEITVQTPADLINEKIKMLEEDEDF